MGIDEREKDPMVLLATLGRRGPSSFICTPIYKDSFTPQHLAQFRQHLGLSTREFALVFNFAPSTINGIETGRYDGREALRRIELYQKVPEAARFELERNRHKISEKKFHQAYNALEKMPLSLIPKKK